MSSVIQAELPLTNRPLFGGVISISVPSSWCDVSLVRQVPDFQEVFQCIDTVENIYKNSVLVIEILERQDQVTNQDAASYFLHDIIESENRTRESVFAITSETMPPTILYHKLWDVGQDCQRSTTSDTDADDKDNLMPNLSTNVVACSCTGIHRERNNQVIQQDHPNPSSTHEDITVIELCVVRLDFVQTDLLISLACTHCKEEWFTGMSYEQGHSNLYRQVLKSLSIHDYSLFGYS